LNYILLELGELFSDFAQILITMARILVKQLDDDLAHVVGKYKVLEKVRNFVHVGVWSRFVKSLVFDVLGYSLRRSSTNYQFENDSPQGIYVAELRYLFWLSVLLSE